MINSLSIIFPCFNEEKTLRKCIEKVLEIADETLSLEIIIVDDGSSDQSLIIARELEDKYQEIVDAFEDFKSDKVARNSRIQAIMSKMAVHAANLNNKLIIVQAIGDIESIELTNFSKTDTNEIVIEDINSNLSSITQTGEILDLLMHKNHLYASYFNYSDSSNCRLLNIAEANIESDNFQFNNLIEFDECKGHSGGGRLKPFIKDGNEGLLITTSQNAPNFLNMKAQDDNSIYGKILFIDLNTKEYEIFAKGFRNPQGLYVNNDLIIITEHGPRGGDEINKILQNKNYGWPVASYGEPYGVGYGNRNIEFLLKNYYKKNHSSYGYEEPLYTFIPSIGISEIIKVSDKFHPKWSNNFLISSLGGRSLYRVKFDEKYSRVLLTEQIYIGRRIRDLIYSEKLDLIFLALEDFGQLGILKPKTIQN